MNARLLRQLEDFALDDPSSGLRFSDRLARENGWSKAYTARVIAEYRKFLYLCAEAGHPVTPSDAVDQVWHLHLCYTESYWKDLCEGILKFPLDHGPTKGGATERDKYARWYERTLASYRKILAHHPPTDIWPPSAVRFKRQRFRRVDAASHFILPKRTAGLFALYSLFMIALAGCGTGEGFFGDFDLRPPYLWIFLGILAVHPGIALLLTVIFGDKGKGGGGESAGGESKWGWLFGSDDGDGGGDSGCGGGCGG